MNPVILLMGPTASGKTAIALELAKYLPIEIINVDSALIYKDMNIGTAKPSIQDQATVPHHLIDIISPLESYSVADFLKSSVQIAENIIGRKKIPVFVGGTMMYFNALINGISELPPSDPIIRAEIENEIKLKGLEEVYLTLKQIDPRASQKIKSTDQQRITRALEVFRITQTPLSELQQQLPPKISHTLKFLCFNLVPENREILHERINARFIKMLQDGLVEEVMLIRNKYLELTINHTSMRSVGYKQVWQYLDNEIKYTDLIEMGQAATRQLAKRQLTWLRNMDLADLQTVKITDLDAAFNLIKAAIR